jgi:hypothetical protein
MRPPAGRTLLTVVVVGAVLAVTVAPGAARAPHIAAPQDNVDVIEVVRFFLEVTVYYSTTNQFQSGVLVTGGTIDAQHTKVYLGFRNKSGAVLNNVEWRIHRVSGGPAPLDSGVQTLPSLAPSQTSWVQVNVPWEATQGSYQLVGAVDPNRKIRESESMRRNNAKAIGLTVGPKMAARLVDATQAGAPQNVSLNVEPGPCEGKVAATSSGLRLSLDAPYPVPIPFPGCVMRPIFYKGARLRHGWTIIRVEVPDAIGNYPPPPSSTYALIAAPSGTALQGQIMLSIPSRSQPCSASNPCLGLVSREVRITIRGPAEQSPYPTLQELLRLR